MGRRVPPLYRRLLLRVFRHRPLTPEDTLQPHERTALLVAALASVTVAVVGIAVTVLSS